MTSIRMTARGEHAQYDEPMFGDRQVLKVVCESDCLQPVYATSGAAAFDIKCRDNVTLDWLRGAQLIRTGLRMEIPEGYELQIRPRSGLAKKGLIILNSPGTIDSDYRGEIMVLAKLGRENKNGKLAFLRGDRIAQCVLAPVTRALFHYVEELDDTDRGIGGFGSTGV